MPRRKRHQSETLRVSVVAYLRETDSYEEAYLRAGICRARRDPIGWENVDRSVDRIIATLAQANSEARSNLHESPGSVARAMLASRAASRA